MLHMKEDRKLDNLIRMRERGRERKISVGRAENGTSSNEHDGNRTGDVRQLPHRKLTPAQSD